MIQTIHSLLLEQVLRLFPYLALFSRAPWIFQWWVLSLKLVLTSAYTLVMFQLQLNGESDFFWSSFICQVFAFLFSLLPPRCLNENSSYITPDIFIWCFHGFISYTLKECLACKPYSKYRHELIRLIII